jgi:single-stranded-DNA-specific exonuclease
MPSANVSQLRAELDAFARTRLTEADFDPVLDVEAELDLDEITPGLFQVLRLLEPYGTGNHEPAFSARGVRLIAPPKILKDKHIKLKLKAGDEIRGHEFSPEASEKESEKGELSAVAILATPSCHPDGAAIRRDEKSDAKGFQLRTENRELRTVFDALGWHMGERLQQTPLLAGDAIDIAFTIGHNDHPDFGGLELTLRDFKVRLAAPEPVPH